MRLHLADVALQQTLLALTEGDYQTARKSLVTGEALVDLLGERDGQSSNEEHQDKCGYTSGIHSAIHPMIVKARMYKTANKPR